MSLKPETQVENPYAEIPAEKTQIKELCSVRFQMSPAGAVMNTNQDLREKEGRCFGSELNGVKS